MNVSDTDLEATGVYLREMNESAGDSALDRGDLSSANVRLYVSRVNPSKIKNSHLPFRFDHFPALLFVQRRLRIADLNSCRYTDE